MKRYLPLLCLPVGLILVAACSSSSSNNNANNNTDGGTTSGNVTTDPDGGGAVGDPNVNPIDGLTAADKYDSPTIGQLSSFLDGPTWSVAQNVFLFTAPEQVEGFVFRLDLNGLVGPTRSAGDPNRTVGQAIDPATGDVIGVTKQAVTRTPVTDKAITDPASVHPICTGYDPATNPPSTDPFDPTAVAPPGTGQFDALNDVVVHSKGHMYFTDPGYSVTPQTNRVYFLPAGSSTAKIVASYPNLDHPNGIALSPDEHTLYVSFTSPHARTPYIGKFAVADDGSIDNTKPAEQFVDLGDGATPDGLAVDTAGNVYVALAATVNVYKATGDLWGTLNVGATGDTVVGLTFGGPNLTTLFITTGGAAGVGGLYHVETKVKGNPQ